MTPGVALLAEPRWNPGTVRDWSGRLDSNQRRPAQGMLGNEPEVLMPQRFAGTNILWGHFCDRFRGDRPQYPVTVGNMATIRLRGTMIVRR